MLLFKFSSNDTPRIFFATWCLPRKTERFRRSSCPEEWYVCIVCWSTGPHGGSVSARVGGQHGEHEVRHAARPGACLRQVAATEACPKSPCTRLCAVRACRQGPDESTPTATGSEQRALTARFWNST